MVKVISLSDEVYKKLKALKGDRSFSETIRDSLDGKRKRGDIMKFCGIWKREEWDEIVRELKESRKKAKLRGVSW